MTCSYGLGGKCRRLVSESGGQLGVAGKLASKVPPGAGQLTILKSDQLSAAQDISKLVRRLPVVLNEEEREVLERWARRPKSAQASGAALPHRLGRRLTASRARIAARLGCSTQTVGRRRGRFAKRGLDGLHDEPRPGKPRQITDEDVERVIVKTLEESHPTRPTGRPDRWRPRPA